MYTCYIPGFKILASRCSLAGLFESYLVTNFQKHIFTWCGSYDTAEVYFLPEQGWSKSSSLLRKKTNFDGVIVNLVSYRSYICRKMNRLLWHPWFWMFDDGMEQFSSQLRQWPSFLFPILSLQHVVITEISSFETGKIIVKLAKSLKIIVKQAKSLWNWLNHWKSLWNWLNHCKTQAKSLWNPE